MAVLYTSDLHFGHANIIRFDHRPFLDVDEMDRFLIQMWNHRVQPEDHVYILGDFCYRNKQPEEWYLRQLKGHKHLIIGNHDWNLLNNEKAMSYFESVDKLLYINDDGNGVQMCHYPLAEWNHMMNGSYHVFGHIHARRSEVSDYMQKKEKALNAGCMINGYAPASLNEMIRMQKILSGEEAK